MRFIPVRFRQRILLGLGVLVLGFLGATASVDMLGIPGTAIQGRFGETRAAASKRNPQNVRCTTCSNPGGFFKLGM